MPGWDGKGGISPSQGGQQRFTPSLHKYLAEKFLARNTQ